MKRKFNLKKGLTRTFGALIIFIIFIMGIGSISNIANANREDDFIQVNVKLGDSLWVIADRYDNNKVDLRKLVYQIKKVNKIDDTIYPGQVLYIPINPQ